MMHRAPGSSWLVLLGGAAVLLAATACQTEGSPATSTPQGPGAGTTPTATSQRTPIATSPAGSTAQPSAASLTISAPADGALVDTAAITIRGQASAGSDVTINGDLVTVGDDGAFTHNVTLEQGANVIEIIATTEDGGEAFQQLTVFYVPAP